ncbi:MAG: hypothetical protein ABI992_05990 [Chthoniobacterales bacterium]
MKPTVQINRRGRNGETSGPASQISNRPITDWSYQTSSPDIRGGATPFHPGAHRVTLHPAFHTLSQGFFSAEANRESRAEGALFGVIAVLAAWPIALAAHAAMVLMR